MPIYDIHHIIPLTPTQCDDLATAITHLHSTRFSTPRLFVNVRFTPTHDSLTYVAGRRAQCNMIIANVRVGPSRTQADWNSLSEELVNAWNRIVPMPLTKGQGHKSQDHELRSVFLVGGLVGGWEAGFPIPPAGGDREWLSKYWEEFNRKADEGDEDFKEMVQEVKERGMLEQNGKSAKEKLEEALGWGDSA